MKPALLDVNVLLALVWPNHQHHGDANRWFERESRFGWATTSITQLAFIRLSSNSKFSPFAVGPIEAARMMKRMSEHPEHQFWDTPQILEPEIFSRSTGPQQVTDAFLVEVARQRNGRLVSFDRKLTAHDFNKSVVHILLPV